MSPFCAKKMKLPLIKNLEKGPKKYKKFRKQKTKQKDKSSEK
jgi:hypothetical protein